MTDHDASSSRIVSRSWRPPFWGHISLFNLREHLISPFVTGYEGTAIESLYPSNTDIFRYAKLQGGIDKLQAMVAQHPGWRSDTENQHVLAQIQEARDIYVKRGQEAR
jgi:hypothetical protein